MFNVTEAMHTLTMYYIISDLWSCYIIQGEQGRPGTAGEPGYPGIPGTQGLKVCLPLLKTL